MSLIGLMSLYNHQRPQTKQKQARNLGRPVPRDPSTSTVLGLVLVLHVLVLVLVLARVLGKPRKILATPKKTNGTSTALVLVLVLYLLVLVPVLCVLVLGPTSMNT